MNTSIYIGRVNDFDAITSGNYPYNSSFGWNGGTSGHNKDRIDASLDFNFNFISLWTAQLNQDARTTYCIFASKIDNTIHRRTLSSNIQCYNGFIGVVFPIADITEILNGDGAFYFYPRGFASTSNKFTGSGEAQRSIFSGDGVNEYIVKSVFMMNGKPMTAIYMPTFNYNGYALDEYQDTGSNPHDVVTFDCTSILDAAQNTKIYNALYGGTTPSHIEGDVDIYSIHVDNSTFDFNFNSLDGVPSGMFKSSYYSFVSTIRYTNSGVTEESEYVDISPYAPHNDDSVTRDTYLSYQSIYNGLGPIGKQFAANDGYIRVTVGICHQENVVRSSDDVDYDEIVRDLEGIVDLYEDGRMSATETSQYFHIHLHPWTTKDGNDDYGENSDLFDLQVPGQEMSVDNILTTSYVLTQSRLRQFGLWLWNNNLTGQLYEYQTAPLENVISCKRIPFDVWTPSPQGDTLNTEIVLGNIHTGIGYDAGSARYDGTVQICQTGHKQEIGEFKIETFNNGDFTNADNKITVYLPYCGMVTLPTGICYKYVKDTNGIPKLEGRRMKIDYFFDICYGTCCAVLYVKDEGEYTMFMTVNGECGIDIPVTASNRAANELAVQKMGANAAASIVGNVIGSASVGYGLGALAQLIGGVVSQTELTENEGKYADTHYTTTGGFSSQIASYLPSSVTVIYDHVKNTTPSTYGHDKGFPCNLTYNLSDLKGYTEIDGACEISGIPCLEEERHALKQALMQGFYL